jgi:flagellar basal body P-ring formation protein FlgA
MIQAILPFKGLRKPAAGLVGLTVTLLLALPAYGAPVCLTLRPAAVVDRETVCLGDIAALSGGSQSRSGELAKTVVARTLMPGQIRFVDLDYIRIRLKQTGFDPGAMTFQGPRTVRITRRAASLPAKEIRRAVKAAILSRMPWKEEDVTIHDIRFDDSMALPTGRLTYRIEPTPHEEYIGRTILGLRLFVDGRPVRKLWVNATITVMAKVVTVIRPLGRYQHIQPADLALERRDLTKLPADTVRNLENAVGNRTTRMIYPHTVLESSMMTAPPLVRRGDIVKIIARSGPMTITATGLAKQQGSKGQMVHVANTDSRRVITARVTGPGTVEVDF